MNKDLEFEFSRPVPQKYYDELGYKIKHSKPKVSIWSLISLLSFIIGYGLSMFINGG